MQYTRKRTFSQKLTDAFSSVASNRSISILLLFVIIAALPVTILLMNKQTQYYGHTAGTLAIPTDGQGMYDGCTPWSNPTTSDYNNCFANIDKMATGGFKLVLNYQAIEGNASGLIAYLNHAQQKGMKVILGMHHNAYWDGTNLSTYFPDMAATCNCTTNTGFIQYVINLVKGNAGLWGYYIGDEETPANHDKIKVYTDLVHATDPTHPRLIVQQTSSTTGYGVVGWADVADVLAQDNYPVGNVSYPLSNQGSYAASVQSYATQNGKDSGFVEQATTWQLYYPPARCSPYLSCAPYPPLSEMEYMLDQTLQNMHPRIILWYSYFDTMSWDSKNSTTQYWNDLVNATQSIYTTPTPTITPTSTPVNTSCSGLTITSPLTLSATTVSPGATLRGTVTYTNQCSIAFTANTMVIAARTSTGTNADFSPSVSGVTVQPGQSVTVSASRTIQTTDPTGQWSAFAGYQDSAGNWTADTNKIYFSVVALTPTINPTNTPVPVTFTPTPIATNLIQNGCFSNTGTSWLSPWFFQVQSGAAGNVVQGTKYHINCPSSARVNITTANSNSWYIQLGQDKLPLTAGHTYTITFYAMANASRSFTVTLQQAVSPYTVYWGQAPSITTGHQWQKFTFSFTPTVSSINTELVFKVANKTGSIWFDAVSLQ
jgi:hypothetical protein